MARRLPDVLGPTDQLTRPGGDEFLVLSSATNAVQVWRLARDVQAFFEKPLRILPGRYHAIGASLGVAIAGPEDDVASEALLGRADIAMYEAKLTGRGSAVLFDADLDRRSRARASIGVRLGGAIAEDAFDLELQPIMGGPGYTNIVGWEALARWHDPDLGPVPPEAFLPLAEQLGLIGDLGELVLRRACRELARLRRRDGNDRLVVAVVVSPVQLLDPRFVDIVREALAAADLPWNALCLEITETTLIGRVEDAFEGLKRLRSAGAHVALVDFGSGYASLATLLRLPMDWVRIDRTLVADVGREAEARCRLGAVVDLVRTLDVIDVIAHGVEDRAQAEALAEIGIPLVQGPLYGSRRVRAATGREVVRGAEPLAPVAHPSGV